MEKALEILKDIRMIENEYDHNKQHRFDEAIAELEEVMKAKTCEGCKWLVIGKYCALPIGTCIRKSDDYFEQKDNA